MAGPGHHPVLYAAAANSCAGAEYGHDFPLRRQFVAHPGLARQLAGRPPLSQHLDFDPQLIAGDHRPPEPRLVDAGEQGNGGAVLLGAYGPGTA